MLQQIFENKMCLEMTFFKHDFILSKCILNYCEIPLTWHFCLTKDVNVRIWQWYMTKLVIRCSIYIFQYGYTNSEIIYFCSIKLVTKKECLITKPMTKSHELVKKKVIRSYITHGQLSRSRRLLLVVFISFERIPTSAGVGIMSEI